jgi:hypothetical protein
MLLGPEWNESIRNPPPEGAQTVEAGVTGGADGDQQCALVDAGLTMMHMEAMPCPAGLAGAAVALQNFLAQASEALAGVGGGAVAGAAEPRYEGKVPAAGAEQRLLAGNAYGGDEKGQKRLYRKIAFAKKHYHRLWLGRPKNTFCTIVR